MIATFGNMHNLAKSDDKGARFCWRMCAKKAASFVRFSKSAIEHEKAAQSVRDFIEGVYHDGRRD